MILLHNKRIFVNAYPFCTQSLKNGTQRAYNILIPLIILIYPHPTYQGQTLPRVVVIVHAKHPKEVLLHLVDWSSTTTAFIDLALVMLTPTIWVIWPSWLSWKNLAWGLNMSLWDFRLKTRVIGMTCHESTKLLEVIRPRKHIIVNEFVSSD